MSEQPQHRAETAPSAEKILVLREAADAARIRYWAQASQLLSGNPTILKRGMSQARMALNDVPMQHLELYGVNPALPDIELLQVVASLSHRQGVLRRELESTDNGKAEMLTGILRAIEQIYNTLAPLARETTNDIYLRNALKTKEDLFELEAKTFSPLPPIQPPSELVPKQPRIPLSLPSIPHQSATTAPSSMDMQSTPKLMPTSEPARPLPIPNRSSPKKRKFSEEMFPGAAKRAEAEKTPVAKKIFSGERPAPKSEAELRSLIEKGTAARSSLARALLKQSSLQELLFAKMDTFQRMLEKNDLNLQIPENKQEYIKSIAVALQRERGSLARIHSGNRLPNDEMRVVLAGVFERFVAEHCDDQELKECISCIEDGDDALFDLQMLLRTAKVINLKKLKSERVLSNSEKEGGETERNLPEAQEPLDLDDEEEESDDVTT